MGTTATFTLAVAALLACSPAAAHAPTATVTPGPDRPGTWVNEGAVLDTTSVTLLADEDRDPSPMHLARAYAAQRDWTCVAPSAAELDDTFLVVPVHPVDGLPYGAAVREVGLDDALDGRGRFIVLLGCDTPKGGA
ncbi:hypothetical protein [Janibacter terrae]|uniref:hypothetical protein n=1 Tax=Janibacter terrae TaxID=103817 RepID=UPI00083525A3|nr:hypothetical protein [Janibacter terrae]